MSDDDHEYTLINGFGSAYVGARFDFVGAFFRRDRWNALYQRLGPFVVRRVMRSGWPGGRT